MDVREEDLRRACETIVRQTKDSWRDVSLLFLLHHEGQRAESIAIAEDKILRHPAGEYAMQILRRPLPDQNSAFAGLAVTTEKGLFGLAHKRSALGLLSVNVDRYTDLPQARSDLYHLAWHAIDIAHLWNSPEQRKKFSNGSMVPKRGMLNMSRATLRADIFSAVMGTLHGDRDSLARLSHQRAMGVLSARAGHAPENYPFFVAAEATQFALSEATRSGAIKGRPAAAAYAMAEDVGRSIDDSAIRQWWALAIPAQDMAWRETPPEMILGSAVNTSENPYVLSNGLLVSEVTQIAPAPTSDLGMVYNAFADPETHAKSHQEATEEAFEIVMAQGVYENSSVPMIRAANEQNRSLAEGRIIGWCAGALQAAARAFDQALSAGESPVQAARAEFQSPQHKTGWKSLRTLGEMITGQKREGYAVTFSDILEMCTANPDLDLAPVQGAIKLTMQDSGLRARMESVYTPAMPTYAPKVKAAPAYQSPGLMPTAAHAPAMGMGMGGGHRAARRPQTTIPHTHADQGERA